MRYALIPAISISYSTDVHRTITCTGIRTATRIRRARIMEMTGSGGFRAARG
jgi:hypothetical protein